MSTERDSARNALVLSGGGARGAWQAGVLSVLAEDHPGVFRIFCGSSVGAVHAAFAAANPRANTTPSLLSAWTSFRLSEMMHSAVGSSLRALGSLTGMSASPLHAIIDGRVLDELIASSIPFPLIIENIGRGRISALAISATNVATGRCTIFVQRAEADPPPWSGDPAVEVRRVLIGLDHVRASAAIPFLLPPVKIGDELFCDGGLRQNVPLSPALHLGAERIVVVSPQSPAASSVEGIHSRLAHHDGPVFLLGKTLDAILDERIDEDLRRLARIDEIIDAGVRRYGRDFVREMSRVLPEGQELRRVHAVAIRPSRSLGAVAAEYVRSADFSRRVRGLLGIAIRRLVEAEGDEADFVSYLLFDGGYARRLIELGRADARAASRRVGDLLAEPLRGAA